MIRGSNQSERHFLKMFCIHLINLLHPFSNEITIFETIFFFLSEHLSKSKFGAIHITWRQDLENIIKYFGNEEN